MNRMKAAEDFNYSMAAEQTGAGVAAMNSLRSNRSSAAHE
jgi:hypothetical protein